MIDNVQLRRGILTDITAIHAIESVVGFTRWTTLQIAQSLRQHTVWVLLDATQTIIAYSMFLQVLDEAELLNIAVAPAMQGQGVGRYLLQQNFIELSQMGVASCFLEVAEGNHAAIALYTALRFSQQGLRKNYYQFDNGAQHALVMRKDLL